MSTNSTRQRTHWLMILVCLLSLVFGSLVATQTSAKAQAKTASTPTITEFPLPTSTSSPQAITPGPDGNMWFTEWEKIGKITPNGSITEFSIPTESSNPTAITSGPDGNMWFTEEYGNNIGQITPTGVVTEFPVPTSSSLPGGITSGPDGNLWFIEWNGNKIGRITPSGSITEFPIPLYNSGLMDITSGPDGNLWFTELNGNSIGRITPSGAITEFYIPTYDSYPAGITSGPDGNLWFTEDNASKIGRITPSGSITEFPIPTGNSHPDSIISGSDGNLWFAEGTGNNIGRVTPNGVVTEFPVPTSSSLPGGITSGPDGNLWFIEEDGNNVGRVNLNMPTPVKPGGMWVYPNNKFSFVQGNSYTLIARGYQAHPTDPAIAYVNVTGFWSNSWHVICHIPNNRPDLGDYYYCTTNLKLNGKYPPAGAMKLSFDVYDIKGNKNLAPNGTPTGTFSTKATPVTKDENTLDTKMKTVLTSKKLNPSSTGELVSNAMDTFECGSTFLGPLLKTITRVSHTYEIIDRFHSLYSDGALSVLVYKDITTGKTGEVAYDVLSSLNPFSSCVNISQVVVPVVQTVTSNDLPIFILAIPFLVP